MISRLSPRATVKRGRAWTARLRGACGPGDTPRHFPVSGEPGPDGADGVSVLPMRGVRAPWMTHPQILCLPRFAVSKSFVLPPCCADVATQP